MQPAPEFYCDKDIARLLRMSPSWVRGQRHKRQKGLPCILDIQPRYIGSSPRYLRADVEQFLSSLAGEEA